MLFNIWDIKIQKNRNKNKDIHQSNYGKPIILMFIGKYGIFPLISLRDIVSISILAMMPENSGDV